MDAGDVEPSRLARARIKLLDLLERREAGQTALVAFTANAFTVTPLTNDTRTIAALVSSLSTDIMPSQGSLIEVALDKSAELLTQSGTGRGEILVLTDSAPSAAAVARAAALASSGVTTHVLAVGTEEGAPIPLPEGGFLSDARNQLVVPQLDVDSLQRIAAAGGGRFARLAADDSDLDELFPTVTAGGILAADASDAREADIWRDQGVWLALALLPLLALAFRRGFVYATLPLLLLPPPEAQAFDLVDLWQRPDQQGMAALERDLPAEAAQLFEDPEWSAAASYRAGDYAASAAALAGIDSPAANYNRGNALALAGQLAEAVAAYDRTLEFDPGHEDAKFNRDLVAALLEQQQQQEQQQEQQQGEPQDDGANPQSGEQGESGESGGDGQGEAPDSAAQGAGDDSAGQDPGDSAPQPGALPEPSAADGDGSAEPGEGEIAEADPGDESDGQALAAASPEEVEDWASEQAADQWLRRIAQDPGGLLRRKFLYQYQQLGVDQDGNRIERGGAVEPW
jgi:Ca-activated chloride channel family protein